MIRIDEKQLKGHVAAVVRQSVEETLNGLSEAEADAICGAKRYERNPERLDTRAGHYGRKLLTSSGEVTLEMPRLRKLPLETHDDRCAAVPASGTGVGSRAWRRR